MNDRPLYLNRSKIPKALICTICSEIFETPIRLSCCHVFCQQCLLTWRAKSNTCPIDRTQIKSLSSDKLVTSIINGLDIFCTNKAKGCKVFGPKLFITHHQIECIYTNAPNEIATNLQDLDNSVDDIFLRDGASESLLSRIYAKNPNLVIG